MKKEIVIVPKDKCPLDVLADMGEATSNSWIFLHKNAIKKLNSIADKYHADVIGQTQECFWNATDKFPETTIKIELCVVKTWLQVLSINADDIAFKERSDDPDNIFFLKMEE